MKVNQLIKSRSLFLGVILGRGIFHESHSFNLFFPPSLSSFISDTFYKDLKN